MFVWACIAPHGGEVIPNLATPYLDRMAQTRSGMETLGELCRLQSPDTIVVMTPHGIYDERYIIIGDSDIAFGELDVEKNHVEAYFEMDRNLLFAIAERCNDEKFPICLVESKDHDGEAAPFPLDWGCLVPLWFMGAKWEDKPKLIVMCPSRKLPRERLIDFGSLLAEVLEQESGRYAFICSADLGHCHDESGPYGYNPISAAFDQIYCQTVHGDNLEQLIDWSEDWIGEAATDAYWQTLVLHGMTKVIPMKPELLTYEAPTYFGMATAEFRRE